MSIKTRLDKLSPNPTEADRLQQAHSAWLFANVLSQDDPRYAEAMKKPLPPPPQAFLDAYVFRPTWRPLEQVLNNVRGGKNHEFN